MNTYYVAIATEGGRAATAIPAREYLDKDIWDGRVAFVVGLKEFYASLASIRTTIELAKYTLIERDGSTTKARYAGHDEDKVLFTCSLTEFCERQAC